VHFRHLGADGLMGLTVAAEGYFFQRQSLDCDALQCLDWHTYWRHVLVVAVEHRHHCSLRLDSWEPSSFERQLRLAICGNYSCWGRQIELHRIHRFAALKSVRDYFHGSFAWQIQAKLLSLAVWKLQGALKANLIAC